MKGISEIIAVILMLMITIAVAGSAYVLINSVFTQQTQGIDISDAYCVYGNVANATVTVRNLGTSPISTSSIIITQSYPSTSVAPVWSNSTIAPGSTATFTDVCEGTGGRSCIYRVSPPTGRSVVASVSCVS